jgi:xanthine dehydrogenase accessory factor
MRDVVDALEQWVADGRQVAVATVIKVERSAPRGPGAVMALSDAGEVVGSVSGGCVEPAVYEEAMQVLASGVPKVLTYGIADEQAIEVGLTCGGTVHIFVERLDW